MSANTIDFEGIYADYAINEEDDDNLLRLKTAVNSLSEADKRIIYLYAELRSMRKVAKCLNVSPATAFHYIHSIREKINERL